MLQHLASVHRPWTTPVGSTPLPTGRKVKVTEERDRITRDRLAAYQQRVHW